MRAQELGRGTQEKRVVHEEKSSILVSNSLRVPIPAAKLCNIVNLSHSHAAVRSAGKFLVRAGLSTKKNPNSDSTLRVPFIEPRSHRPESRPGSGHTAATVLDTVAARAGSREISPRR